MIVNPRQYQLETIIIKKTRLGEAGRILTFYTQQRGKIQGLAKGVSKTKSKLSGHLELLSYSQVSLTRGKSINIITGSQTIDSFLPLRSRLEPLSYGLYFAELLNHFGSEGDACPPIFELMISSLKELCEDSINYELLRYYFEMKLLKEAGYCPQLRECVSCHSKIRPDINHFSTALGGILCSSCASLRYVNYPISTNALKILRILFYDDYATTSRLKLTSGLYREISSLSRNYISYILEREVKSLGWLDEVKKHSSSSLFSLL